MYSCFFIWDRRLEPPDFIWARRSKGEVVSESESEESEVKGGLVTTLELVAVEWGGTGNCPRSMKPSSPGDGELEGSMAMLTDRFNIIKPK